MPRPQTLDEPCTYFDQRTACSICGARPAMRKTGKCAPHSVAPYDFSRVDDWVDCYEGCIKHDPVARRRAQERKRSGSPSPLNAIQPIKQVRADAKLRDKTDSAPEIIPLPSIDRLYLLHKHPKEERDERLANLISDLIKSRGISQAELWRGIGITESMGRRRFGPVNGYNSRRELSFMETCDALAYLRQYDNDKKMGHIR